VTAGSERLPRPSPAYPAFMGPCVLAGAPTRLPRRRSAGHSPWMTPPSGPAGQPPQGGTGAPYSAPLPLPHLAGLEWPAPATRPPSAPLTRRCTHSTATTRTLLAPAGSPPHSGAAPAGVDRGSTRAPHWGGRRLTVLARP